MKRLKITNDHGWTPRKLRKQERKIKDASLCVRVTAVRLVMEGFLGKDVAKWFIYAANWFPSTSPALMKVGSIIYSIVACHLVAFHF